MPGQFVSQQVQLKHHLSDVDASTSSHISSSLDSSLEPEIAEDQNLNSKGSDLGYEQLQLDACDTSLTVITLLGVFLGWLHLFCGLSGDMWPTIKRLSVILELKKQICCVTCFSLYKPSDTPCLCSYKKS
ncbi:hypothetical protein CROQUDRAFT_659910 [Cronartium quercuum f. sp. fusiforme G11]|uniref:Uncharacterized protein n=1 Tax=Cronartium quercuum f. sp. fusiforme G11 TaxID=708437 RepID=A0A9P6NF68_9BASI|nr:hypothetical protein CROQUDRAFT_659910 [Cronartium quercuum f. sp. fusiforme G11]